MPLFHVGGSLTQALTTLSAGGCLVVLSPPGWRNPASVKNIWGLIDRYKREAFSSVPTVLAAALGIPPGNADISSLKFAAAGGSAIPVAVGKAIQDKLKLPVLEVYGMTETSSVHTIAYPERPIRLGSAGLPVPYCRVRIVKLDADGRFERDCATGRDRRRHHGRARRVRRLSQRRTQQGRVRRGGLGQFRRSRPARQRTAFSGSPAAPRIS